MFNILMDIKFEVLEDYFKDFDAFLYFYQQNYKKAKFYYKTYKIYVLYTTSNKNLIVHFDIFNRYYEKTLNDKETLIY
jgi:hypothetical protein